MTEPTLPTKRRHGWRMLGLIVLGMVLLTFGGGFWWYYHDHDLEHVREQARQQGRPLTWNDLGLKPADSQRMERWTRIKAQKARLKGYQSLSTSARGNAPAFKDWDPIPQEMRDHHQSLDAVAIKELGELLDQLGDAPLVLREELTFSTSMPEIGENRELIRFMQERMLLAEGHEVGIWGRRMLALCRRYSAESLMAHLVRVSLIGVTLTTISQRLEELQQSDPAIASDILNTTQHLHRDLLQALDGEFIMMLDLFTRRINYNQDWFMPLINRAGRQGALLAALEARQELTSLDGPGELTWARAMEAKLAAARQGIPSPTLIAQGMFMPAWSVFIGMGQRTALQARLLAAELQGQPWPTDTFDPTGAMLRPILRDGRVIAAYSLGDDGINQGGDAKLDRIFPLYAKP